MDFKQVIFLPQQQHLGFEVTCSTFFSQYPQKAEDLPHLHQIIYTSIH